MSIGKRLFNFARSELNSLLDRAAELDSGDPDADTTADGPTTSAPPRSAGGGTRGRKVRLEDLSDAELEAEIERRRLERELNERATRASRASESAGARRPTGARESTGTRPRGPSDPIAKAYAALEVPPGSDFETVRKAYRSMMRKYHPDRHTASPDKQKAANELAQKLTESYKILEKKLRKP